MKNDGKSELVEPFDVDDGSLEGLAPSHIFTLGVEWQLFRQRLASGKHFTTLCLPENAERFVKMAERHKRFVEDRPNVTPGWSEVYVGDYLV